MAGILMISALKSGSGKTSFVCGLLSHLKRKQIKVTSFKSGPDYIDPMFHRTVIGVPSRNLDTFFSSGEQLKELVSNGIEEDTEVAIIEGAMGIYDGMGVSSEKGSAYDLACKVNASIVLLVDAKGMGRTIISVLKGIIADDHDRRIRGIVLNRISPHYYELLKPEIENNLGLKVYGYVPVMKNIAFESRHLGLKLPQEMAEIHEKIDRITDQLEQTVDFAGLRELINKHRVSGSAQKLEENPDGPVIAVARDDAFCFYYQENLEYLQKCGARLAYFSPLSDEKLPENAAGLYLGGGYPELYTKELAANTKIKDAIKAAIESGMPSFAECGGFMYLQKELEGESMVGVIDSSSTNTGKLVRFGYIELKAKANTFLPMGEEVKAHEFHYYDSTINGDDVMARKPSTGKEYGCVLAGENHWWGYPHIYFPSNINFVNNFVLACKSFLLS